MGDEKREPESKTGHHWSAWEGGRRICMRCDKVESMTSEQWDEHLAAREPESKGASPDRRRVRPQWWEYPDDVEIELLKAAPAMAVLLRLVGIARTEGWYEDNSRWAEIDGPLNALLDRIGR